MRTVIFILFINILFISSSSAQFFWTEHVSGVTVSLTSVSNINGMNAWICGNNGTVLRTTDGGYNWTNLSGNGIPANVSLVNIFGLNNSTAIVSGFIGSNTFVFRTTNSGTSWQQVFTQTGGFINSVWMTAATNGFMEGDPVGGRWSLWKTTDSGANWDSSGLYLAQSGSESGWNNSLWLNGTKIWFGTNNSRIYYSSNSGTNWLVQTTPANVNIYSIWFETLSALTGFAAGDSLRKTTNSGSIWLTNPSIGAGNFNSFTGAGGVSNYWYIRNSQNIYASLGGTSWSIQYTAPAGLFNHMAAFRSGFTGGPGFILAVRSNGGISRCNFFVEGVTIISGEIPSNYVLHQNYPNPFNAATVFKFEAPLLPSSSGSEVRGGYVRLITYNALGQEIGSLVNEVLQPGTYKVEWEGKDKPSGIYFYRFLVTDPNSGKIVFNHTRKMVMIK